MKKRLKRSFATATGLCTNNVRIKKDTHTHTHTDPGLCTGAFTQYFSLTPSFPVRFSGKDESDDSDDEGKAKKKDDSDGDDGSSASGKRSLEAFQPLFYPILLVE